MKPETVIRVPVKHTAFCYLQIFGQRKSYQVSKYSQFVTHFEQQTNFENQTCKFHKIFVSQSEDLLFEWRVAWKSTS